MFKRESLNDWKLYFMSCSERGGEVYYFCRIDSYSRDTGEFLGRYMDGVKRQGVYLKGKIPNPDERQLGFLEEIVGTAFLPDGNFIRQTLKKWLPRLNDNQLEAVTTAMFQILIEMKRTGKTENMLKNAYFKFMCWFYYKFERILSQLGGGLVPKILYEGEISDYELKCLRILGNSGCDILLVERNGDQAYRKLDPDSQYSQLFTFPGAGTFPEGLSLAKLSAEKNMVRGSDTGSAGSPVLGDRVGPSNETAGPVSHGGGGAPSGTGGAAPSAGGRVSSGMGGTVSGGGGKVSSGTGGTVPGVGGRVWSGTGGAALGSGARTSGTGGPAPGIHIGGLSRQRGPESGPSGRGAGGEASHHPASFQITTEYRMGTNIWLTGEIFEDSLKKAAERGNEPKTFYNLFVCLKGCDAPGEYKKELVRWKLKLDQFPRRLLIIDRQLGMPDMNEISRVRRGNYTSEHQLLADMLTKISYPKCRELENLVKKGFVELLTEESKPLQAKMNQAVLLICWLNRFIPQLFPEWRLDTNPVFLFFGNMKNENEALFLRLLGRIPVDVLILCPDPSALCEISDSMLFEKSGAQPVGLDRFPQSAEDISFGSAAYQAEQELNTVLYQNSGIYRNRQFKRAITVPIRITYEEIGILWKQEAKYRPDFEALDDRVMLPVIFSKVSGVTEGDWLKYWRWVKGMLTEDTLLIKGLPYITDQTQNPVKSHVTSFLKSGKLQVDKIRRHPSYQYGFIREDMQDYMLDKLEQLLESKVIAGTFTQGVEYTICSVALNLDKKLLRILQKYDFTKQIPKLILINTTESLCTLEDSIMTAYLNLLGFDVLILIPTGYQSVERYYTRPLFVEHQIGDYVYDMTVPDLYGLSGSVDNLIEKLFKRGR